MSPKNKVPKMSKKQKAFLSCLLLAVLIIYYLFFDPSVEANLLPVTTSTATQSAPSSQLNYEVHFTSPQNDFVGNTQDSIEYQLIEKIDSAQSTLQGAFFEFDLQSVADALIRAHDRGVNVQIVYDDEHTEQDPQMAMLARAGIKTIPDERSAFMHNKFLVVDGACVWTGSFNLTVNAAYKNNENAVYLCDQEIVQNYQTEFSEMFAGQFGPTSPENTPHLLFDIDGARVQNYFAPEDNVMDKVISTVADAKTSVRFLAFSFTDENLAQEMVELANRGVIIEGVFETRGASTDSSMCSYLSQNGASIRTDGNKYTMHHKVIIIDQEVVIFGSFNFSNNANKSNDENLVIVYDQALAKDFEQEFFRVYSQSNIANKNCD